MSAYVISEVEVLDEGLAERYRDMAAASIEHHGGRYVVRGARPDPADGEWPPARRLVIVEFPDLATARRWYDSDDYAPARELAGRALRRRLLFADGVGDGAVRG